MKKTQFIDAVRMIRNRFVSFLSIAFIIMLGTGGFFMTRYTGVTLIEAARELFHQQNFKDYEMASSIGITEDDIASLQAVEGVKDAEGAEVLNGILLKDRMTADVLLMSWTDKINIPLLLEGKKPSSDRECAVDEDTAVTHHISIGDTVSLHTEQLYGSDPLANETYTVTGIVRLVDDIRNDVQYTVVLPIEGFNMEGLQQRYSRVYLTASDADDRDLFGSGYADSTAETAKRLKELLPALELRALNDAKRIGSEMINAELAKAQEQIDDANRQLEEGEAELESQLAYGRQQLASARQQLNQARNLLLNGEAQLRDAEAMLAALHTLEATLNGVSHIDMLNYLREFRRYIEVLEAAGTEEEINAAREALRWFLNQEAVRPMNLVFEALTGIDPVSLPDTPGVIPDVKPLVDELSMVIILADAAAAGISPQDMIDDLKTISGYLAQISNAASEEARNASYEMLAAYLSDPAVMARLAYIEAYSGISAEQLLIYAQNGTADGFASLRSMLARLQKIRQDIVNAEAMIAGGRAELNRRWAQYYEGVRLLQEKEREMIALESEARAKLADARYQLEAKIREGEAQLAEVRERLDHLTCNWIIQDRTLNHGYYDLAGNVNAAFNMGYALGLLFLIVAALVCFSTLVIIVEEERKLVGVTKAFGFKNNEILGKYLIFAVSASMLGALLGIALAYGIAVYTVGVLVGTRMYAVPVEHILIEGHTTLAVSIGGVLLCAGVAVLACTGLLKSTAYQLMNGITKQADKNRKQKQTRRPSGSLYSRLIIRNMVNEKARVLISMVIIAGSCAVIGIGLTIKYAFDGMIRQELRDVTVYDYAVSFPSKVGLQEQQAAEQMFDEAGISWVAAAVEAHAYERDERTDGFELVAADPKKLQQFIRVIDPDTNKETAIPEHGLVIRNRIRELNGYAAGDTITVLDQSLNDYSAPISGIYLNYLGRTALCSETAYREIFGTAPVHNCYYIQLNGADEEAFKTKLAEISPEFSPERADAFLNSMKGSFMLYNLIVAISIGIAVIMSFIILTNLANIFLSRKKKELTVMRINGFTIGQTIIYLARETVITVAVGLVLGVLFGLILAPFLVRILEPQDCQFIRSANWTAWIIAVVLETLFAFGINFRVFRKVKDLTFRDVTG